MPSPAVLLLLAAQASGPAEARAGDPSSVERLLETSRERAQQMRASAAGAIRALLEQLDVPYEGNQAFVDDRIAELHRHRDLATRPLADALAELPDRARGSNAARALAASPERNVFSELERVLAEPAPPHVRARVAWILGRRTEPGAVPLLRKFLAEPDDATAAEAGLSLARLQVKDSSAALAERLATASAVPLARSLLSALGQVGETNALASVLSFAEKPAAVECAAELAEVVRSLRSRELLVPAIKIASHPQVSTDGGVALLRAVKVSSADREAVALLKKLLEDSDARVDLREEAAYALARAKEPVGAQWLLKQPNEALRETPDNPVLLRKRGWIHLRLGRYREAVHDYEELRRVSRRSSLSPEAWLELARAHAGAKTYASAAEGIRQATALGLRPKSFRDYEEFAEMRKNPKYAPLFDGSGE
jgi:HEAT repeat protein